MFFSLGYFFFSRQRYVIGDEAMHRLSDSTVLICGLGGVGVEIGIASILLKLTFSQKSRSCWSEKSYSG